MEQELEEQKMVFEYKFLVPLYPLKNIEITKHFNYETRFNGI